MLTRVLFGVGGCRSLFGYAVTVLVRVLFPSSMLLGVHAGVILGEAPKWWFSIWVSLYSHSKKGTLKNRHPLQFFTWFWVDQFNARFDYDAGQPLRG